MSIAAAGIAGRVARAFSIGTLLPGGAGPWLTNGFLFDREHIGGLECPTIEKRLIFRQVGRK